MNNFFKKIVQFFLKWLAKIYLGRIKPRVIVVAGTTGRHWVKEAVVEALKEKKLPVRANIKNFNAEIGLPLSILDLPSGEGSFWRWLKVLFRAIKKVFSRKLENKFLGEFIVLEMAIDRPDNMKYLLSIVKPSVAIFTSVTMIYAENFENLDAIAAEYEKLIKVLSWNGLTILNFDDERVKNLSVVSRNRIITYGFGVGADYEIKNFRKVADGQELEIKMKRSLKILTIKINRFGNHHIYAALVKEIIRENYRIAAPDFFNQVSTGQAKLPNFE